MKRIFLTISILIIFPSLAHAATITSAQSGNWSSTSTWVGGTKPGDGDAAVIATGHVVVVDENTTLGANDSGVGHAITINGTDGTTYGKLQVADGVTLTLKGYDLTSNTMMLINRYAVFEPLPGSTIVGDIAGDYTSFILNKGIVNAIGTEAKPIVFTSPSGAYSWNNDVASEAFSGTAWKYDPVNKIAAVAFTNYWVSNAAGTGLGSIGDSSVSFSSQSPATILQTEVSSLALVNGAGKYYIDYDIGVVWFYHDPADGNPSFTKTYKYLTLSKGWGISSIQNTTYNEAKFDYCNFSYLGKNASADNRVIDVKYNASTSSEANRLFYLKNSTFSFTARPIGFKNLTGTAADPILISGNTFNTAKGDGTYGGSITAYRAPSSYISVINNTIKNRAEFGNFFSYGSVLDFTGYKFSNNSVLAGNSVLASTIGLIRFPSGEVKNNTITGIGNTADYRAIASMGGASGSLLVISGNTISKAKRSIHYGPYSTISGNIIIYSFHHGIVAPTEDDLQISDVTVNNNIFVGEAGAGSLGYDDAPSIETGYNHRQWLDNFQIYNNTMIGNPNGWFGFGDIQDTGAYSSVTNLIVRNNLAMMNTSGTSKGARRRADSTSSIWRGHVLQFDYNLDYNYATRYENLTHQGTFAGISNVAGVSLFDPSFSSKTGGALAFVYTSATDQTLAWGSGSAVQLVLDNGTATAGANTSTSGVTGLYNGTLTDSAKTWTTTKNDSGCPMMHWVKITGGTGVGQIRMITNNTATVLTVAPAWSTIPDATSTYAIIKTEVTLADGAESVQAGIYPPDLPTSSQTDSSISFADHSITAQSPLLTDSTGITFAAMTPQAGSPADGTGFGGVDIGAVPLAIPAIRKRAVYGFDLGFGFGF